MLGDYKRLVRREDGPLGHKNEVKNVLTDVLTDLLHLADREDLDPERIFRSARDRQRG